MSTIATLIWVWGGGAVKSLLKLIVKLRTILLINISNISNIIGLRTKMTGKTSIIIEDLSEKSVFFETAEKPESNTILKV